MKRDKDGKYIDHYTNTVEDAAAFEAYYNADPPDRPDPADYMDDDVCVRCGTDLEDELCKDITCPFSDYAQDDEMGWTGYCNCSDPCCPCTGNKRGVP